ncbi:hypothetical protein AVEN_214082-1 [Araneus ventricosus]|uniref:Uncharacterized protein n=1 Tax=Araneus ventricosus TaxID=182803 RepID=A0A4Y2NR85_ARAVE|nr:hypothetical protein AVEN_214082-1 [Araneus ventricosus]
MILTVVRWRDYTCNGHPFKLSISPHGDFFTCVRFNDHQEEPPWKRTKELTQKNFPVENPDEKRTGQKNPPVKTDERTGQKNPPVENRRKNSTEAPLCMWFVEHGVEPEALPRGHIYLFEI